MLPSLLRVLPLLHLDGLSAPTRRSRDAQANLLSSLFRGNADSSSWSGQSVDVAPSWSELKAQWEGAATADERSFRALLESGRLPHASALAKRRLFDLPDGQEPRVTFYRDTAAWCPYCEKVWLTLEEKRVPYTVEKVNMNCYGDKPAWFWAMQPSGGIPVAKLDGQVIRESNDIIMAIERAFPEHPMLPNEAYLPDQAARTQPLFRLERELFNAWFRWMTSSVSEGAQRKNLESILIRVEGELGVAGGPFFLGKEVTLVDCFFAPFLERMAASLPYYKGLRVRANDAFPNLERWFRAMEARPSYRHIQSDFYTHVHDLPPQIGSCQSVPDAAADAATIDGGSWTLNGISDMAELHPPDALGLDPQAARREAAERLLANHVAVARFAARGLGRAGKPPVSAPLSDPRASFDEAVLPLVDSSLRHVVDALLAGPEAAAQRLIQARLEPRATAAALGYLRDRISVPRDMSYPAAMQARAHMNWVIEEAGKVAAKTA
ncbi:glutathione s-transferase [Chrysochromulina tobinii]|uniref:Glutathione s-transferase n=1 Tax=Chrysochromulina tobinii TaxID=1460289 RepID=A0A0M0K383_9EUKA|nr:glutathione s-transferase [Chrysochromulina tobinii]|eukprot:KOO32848.1 glutathione s-transferase [Chrysochromulina sp. CCMP291]